MEDVVARVSRLEEAEMESGVGAAMTLTAAIVTSRKVFNDDKHMAVSDKVYHEEHEVREESDCHIISTSRHT
jgi:hypothetical protein